ncbi:MAG: energy transducer TonB [Akkermansia sp.]
MNHQSPTALALSLLMVGGAALLAFLAEYHATLKGEPGHLLRLLPDTASSPQETPTLPTAPPLDPPELSLPLLAADPPSPLPDLPEAEELDLDSAPSDSFPTAELSPAPAHPVARQESLPRPASRREPARPSTAATASASSAESSTPITPASYRSAPPPPYPASLRERRISGSVGLRIRVSATGRPTAAEVTSAAHPDLNSAAIRWVLAHWTFHPATRNGTPIDSTIRTSVRFVLD